MMDYRHKSDFYCYMTKSKKNYQMLIIAYLPWDRAYPRKIFPELNLWDVKSMIWWSTYIRN